MSAPAREPDDRTPLIHQESPAPPEQSPSFLDKTLVKILIGLSSFVILILVAGLTVFIAIRPHSRRAPSAKDLTSCAWNTLESRVYVLDVEPIDRTEFLSRQATLAATLKEEGIDAYITEPSASSLYYFNISASYSLSERPFLAILSSNGSFSYLAPEFELGRIAGLDMVYDEKTIIEWKEEESPYAALKREIGNGISKVMVDEQARFFITSGLEAANFTVLPVSPSITSLRAVKSDAEIEILQAINQYTIYVVRSLQQCLQIGITQESLFDAAHTLFSRAGVGLGFWAVVLFGEQAANPHGGSKGKTLEEGEFVLIDIGSKLYGYNSDVTRTILPDNGVVSEALMDVWYLVRAAQEVAIETTSEGTLCSAVDAASRKVIADGDYGPYFTHRLGHGLGLEGHEHPYLNGANNETLKLDAVVTNEPGIYVTGAQAKSLGLSSGFGVRIEDPVVVRQKRGMLLTGRRADSPWTP